MISATEYNHRFDFNAAPAELAAQMPSALHLLVGQSIRESHSFRLYAEVLRSLDCEARYQPFEIDENDEARLTALLEEFRRNPVMGTLVFTDPFKQRVTPYMDALTHTARGIGAINFASKQDGRVLCDNLDGVAFTLGCTNWTMCLLMAAPSCSSAVVVSPVPSPRP